MTLMFAIYAQAVELSMLASQSLTSLRHRPSQPLDGGKEVPPEMERMLRLQLAKVHYGDANAASLILQASSTLFMNWGRNPFGTGYHAWSAHYDTPPFEAE